MARPEVTGKKSAARPKRRRVKRGPLPVPTHVFSIPSFCRAYGFSEAFFHKLVSQRNGPRLMKIGARTFITFTAAEEWKAQREAATTASITAAE